VTVFVDTSAFYAFLSKDDSAHERVTECFGELTGRRERLMTNSYVLSETMGLLQQRGGWTALRRFLDDVAPLVNVVWITAQHHAAGCQLMRSSPSRHFSVVDATAMVTMREEGLTTCIGLDTEFTRQGFRLIP
jgi:predicted nucleic acid-binding protein